jgi:patatin-related protein
MGDQLGWEELRIALAMNGGASLAVWIGGVTREVGRLLSLVSAYGELAELLQIRPRVDVIAGTSAGGVNGAYLGLAIARREPGQELEEALAGLRQFWVNSGAIDSLLRSPLEKAPPSLLDGDGFYYRNLLSAFSKLAQGDATNKEQFPVDLMLTGTLLRGEPKKYSDDCGVAVGDVSHRAVFRFRRGSDTDGDPFSTGATAAQLAVAARTTSSFPGAFEPSFCPVNDTTGSKRPDMNGIASRYLVDGGVLDNKPLDIALESIFSQPATGPARRVLAYVIPAPASTAAAEADKEGTAPGLLQTVLSCIVEIPSVQSVSAQLDMLQAHNRTVRDKRRSRVVITRHNNPAEIDALSTTLFEAYRDVRIASALDYVLGEVDAGLVAKGGQGLGRHGRRDWMHDILYQRKEALPWIPTRPPIGRGASDDQGGSQSRAERRSAGWRWGARPVEHAARILLDLVVRTQQIAPPTVDLAPFWSDSFALIKRADGLRKADQAYWREQAPGLAGDDRDTLLGSFAAAIEGWRTVADASETARGIAAVVLRLCTVARGIAAQAGTSPDSVILRNAEDLRGLVNYFLRGGTDNEEDVLARLLAFDVVQEALGTQSIRLEEEISFIQITADDPGQPARDRLNGIQLAHFGAFYKRSWRANDWLWGRRNATKRLVGLMLDPTRVRAIAQRSGLSAAKMAERIQAIATGFCDQNDETASLRPGSSLEAITAELAFLDDTSLPVPERLDISVEAIADRLELEILCEELPSLARAIQSDQEDAMATSLEVSDFAKQCLAAETVSGDRLRAADAANLARCCNLGGESLRAEAGTDVATETVAKVLAVGVAALQSDKGLLASLGKAVGVLRVPTLLFYAFARNLRLRSRTGLALNVAVFAAALVIFMTALLSPIHPYPHWLVALACAALPPALLLLAFRFKPGWAIGAIIVLAGAIFSFIYFLEPRFTPELLVRLAAGEAIALVLLALAPFVAGLARTFRAAAARSSRARRGPAAAL